MAEDAELRKLIAHLKLRNEGPSPLELVMPLDPETPQKVIEDFASLAKLIFKERSKESRFRSFFGKSLSPCPDHSSANRFFCKQCAVKNWVRGVKNWKLPITAKQREGETEDSILENLRNAFLKTLSKRPPQKSDQAYWLLWAFGSTSLPMSRRDLLQIIPELNEKTLNRWLKHLVEWRWLICEQDETTRNLYSVRPVFRRIFIEAGLKNPGDEGYQFDDFHSQSEKLLLQQDEKLFLQKLPGEKGQDFIRDLSTRALIPALEKKRLGWLAQKRAKWLPEIGITETEDLKRFLEHPESWETMLQEILKQPGSDEWFFEAFESIRHAAKGLVQARFLDHAFISVPPPLALFEDILDRIGKRALGLEAPPGWGKSRLVLWLALWFALRDIPTIYFEEPRLITPELFENLKNELKKVRVCLVVDDYHLKTKGPSLEDFEDLVDAVQQSNSSYIILLQTQQRDRDPRRWPISFGQSQVIGQVAYRNHWELIWRDRFQIWFQALQNTPVAEFIALNRLETSKKPPSYPWNFVATIVDLRTQITENLDTGYKRLLFSILALGYVVSGEQGLSARELYTGLQKLHEHFGDQWKRIRSYGGPIWEFVNANNQEGFEECLRKQIKQWQASPTASYDHFRMQMLPYDPEIEWGPEIPLRIHHTAWWKEMLQSLWDDEWGKKDNGLLEVIETVILVSASTIEYPTSLQKKMLAKPDILKHCEQIEGLSWRFAKIQHLPTTIGQLQNIQELDLTGNQLKTLPETFGALTNLKKLYLSNNKLTSLPKSFGLLSIQVLNLSNNQLEALPQEITNLKNLQVLNLNNNQLETLPQEINDLENLQELYLRNNKEFKEFPEDFHPPCLHTFILEDCQLKKLSETFQPPAIHTLRIENTKINSLPEKFGSLTKLRILYLERNELTYLPSSFGELNALEILGLNYNKFEKIPCVLSKLSKIRELKLHENQLDSTSASKIKDLVESLKDLEKINLTGNSELSPCNELYEGKNEINKLVRCLASFQDGNELPAENQDKKNFNIKDYEEDSDRELHPQEMTTKLWRFGKIEGVKSIKELDEEEEICEKIIGVEFKLDDDDKIYQIINGKKELYHHDNEQEWKIINGKLCFLTKEREISTEFKYILKNKSDAKLKLVGRFYRKSLNVFHILTEI
ncbi:MAG: leucine-rich repeat domain-containing protein [Candidatus Hodarchaeota archaeon]